ncbi:hypothetical protein M0802_000519 [Mischocyttarus mexicanus]|nr:hypothetical protein M0802_000519 [Mischocyttarus mexicanus]
MGGAVSSGQNNDELVDNLVTSGYIRTKKVEEVFRAVDRADYFLSSHRESAYKDLAWKHGNIHLSAPCVYSLVIEGLSLEPGLSFLNLGSGTGYLSTMAGLILKHHGTNHGIELHEDCLKYAYERLEEFKHKSLALDEFDFCEPSFVQGNCLSIAPGRQYDRVYCGAACPESHEALIKQYVKVGGILVMPFKEHLLRIQRIEENDWIHHTMLPVSFASLIVPRPEEQNLCQLPECDPLSLQELCRDKIRHRLRENVWREHVELEIKKPILLRHQRSNLHARTLKRFVIPIFEESNEPLSEDEDIPGRARLLLNVDTHPGEAITTTLQLVRAVIQPRQHENRLQHWQESNDEDSDGQYIVTSVDMHHDNNEERKETDSEALLTEAGRANTSENIFNSSYDQSQDQVQKQPFQTLEQHSSLSEAYTNMSESDSDSEDEQETSFTQRKKIVKREKSDSGIIEDANLTTDDGSSSSNTSQSDSKNTDDLNSMEVDLSDISIDQSFKDMYNKTYSDSAEKIPNENVIFGHYVDGNAFSTYMKEKINQLPLPYSLKLYINYNRHL